MESTAPLLFLKGGKIQLKICKKCGVVVEDNAVLFCPECGAGQFQQSPQESPKKMKGDTYYNDVLPEDAGQEEKKQNNTGLYVKICLVGFAVAIIVSACAVVAFMM